ncbi:GNAT family N-acetyltransferase [Kribbella sp. NPDC006257]|uniref:GNAT family N-acetyltransferase n=1 Tax=Kribbella sp. NPDC006257 TaxID=3156738 RepID=UPI0033BB65C1
MELRRLQEEDLAGLERVAERVFLEPGQPGRPPAIIAAWISWARHFLTTDPAGCWVSVDEGITGFALSQNRGELWYLATYGVLPEARSTGIGRRLLDVVLEHAGDRPGIFNSTTHPGATRRYRLAGFDLLPQMRMTGTVDRSAIPAIRQLAEGDENDFDWMDALDTNLRGAGHGPDHAFLLNSQRLVVSRSQRGYVYVDQRARATLLAAADPRTAQELLWEALASSTGDTVVDLITPENAWAIDVGLAARLDLATEGYLAVRGMAAPAPYLPGGRFL